MGFWYFINVIGLSGLPATEWVYGIGYQMDLERLIWEQKSNNGLVAVTTFHGNPLENKPCKVELLGWARGEIMDVNRTFWDHQADAMHAYYDKLSTDIWVRDANLI